MIDRLSGFSVSNQYMVVAIVLGSGLTCDWP